MNIVIGLLLVILAIRIMLQEAIYCIGYKMSDVRYYVSNNKNSVVNTRMCIDYQNKHYGK